jgi:LPXTG-motif cell wall-anchored protein
MQTVTTVRKSFAALAIFVAVGALSVGRAWADDSPETPGETAQSECVDEHLQATSLMRSMSGPVADEVVAGETVMVVITWAPADFTSLSELTDCIEVRTPNGTVGLEQLGIERDEVANNGTFSRTFVVPAGLPDGSMLCGVAALEGDPAKAAKKGLDEQEAESCLKVLAAHTTTTTTTAPTTTTTTAAPTTTTTAPTTTTTGGTPTTLAGASVLGVTITRPAAAATSAAALPATGSSGATPLLAAGLLFMVLGGVALQLGRRRGTE